MSCTLKQLDSRHAHTNAPRARTGLAPSLVCGPTQGNLGRAPTLDRSCFTPHVPSTRAPTGFGAGLFPFHSPLLGEYWLVSFPPLSDMLKFSGSSRLIRGCTFYATLSCRTAHIALLGTTHDSFRLGGSIQQTRMHAPTRHTQTTLSLL